MGVNLTGMMYCMRAELQAMKGPGSVVCVSSVQGTLGFAKHAAYAASKHGILGLVKSAAKEEGERGIRVNAITPFVDLLKQMGVAGRYANLELGDRSRRL